MKSGSVAVETHNMPLPQQAARPTQQHGTQRRRISCVSTTLRAEHPPHDNWTKSGSVAVETHNMRLPQQAARPTRQHGTRRRRISASPQPATLFCEIARMACRDVPLARLLRVRCGTVRCVASCRRDAAGNIPTPPPVPAAQKNGVAGGNRPRPREMIYQSE